MSKGQKKEKKKRTVTFIQLSEKTKTCDNTEFPLSATTPPMQAEMQGLFKESNIVNSQRYRS